MNLRAFIHHKRAERYSDCQDYFGFDLESRRIAISDGMSQSIYPQWWAKILVDAYLERGTAPIDIVPYQRKWQDQVNDEIERRESAGENPWRLKNSFSEKSGAGATLCGITWSKDGWICECLGDSCLIAVGHDYEIQICTSQKNEFGNHPDYYDSFGEGKGKVEEFRRNFIEVEMLLLVTDPFSELFQKHKTDTEFIKSRIDEIKELTDHQSFVDLVENWRDRFNMHNDDSTLIVLNQFESVESVSKEHVDVLSDLCKEEQEPNKPEFSLDGLNTDNPLSENDNEYKDLPKETENLELKLIDAIKVWFSNCYKELSQEEKIRDAIRSLVERTVDGIIKKSK